MIDVTPLLLNSSGISYGLLKSWSSYGQYRDLNRMTSYSQCMRVIMHDVIDAEVLNSVIHWDSELTTVTLDRHGTNMDHPRPKTRVPAQ